MKKLLIGLMFIMMSFIRVANVSAASIGSQSMDVTVGEVDMIDGDNGDQNVSAPDTGVFGLDGDSAAVFVAALLIIPIAAIITSLFRYTYRKH